MERPSFRNGLASLTAIGLLLLALPGCRKAESEPLGPKHVEIRFPCRHVDPLYLLSTASWCKECRVDMGEVFTRVNREIESGDSAFRRGDGEVAMEHYSKASEIIKWMPDLYTTVLKVEVSEKIKCVRSGRTCKDIPPCRGCDGSSPCFGD